MLGDVNVNDPINVLTLQSPNVTLPTGSTSYYLGVIVDPNNSIREIHEVGVGTNSTLSPIRQVGPPIAGSAAGGRGLRPRPDDQRLPVSAVRPDLHRGEHDSVGLDNSTAVYTSSQITDPVLHGPSAGTSTVTSTVARTGREL